MEPLVLIYRSAFVLLRCLRGRQRRGEPAARKQFKAWSQNLGHDSPLTTFTSYGEIATSRQMEIIGVLGRNNGSTPSPEAMARALELIDVARRL